MTTYNIEYFIFLISFVAMIIDGEIDSSEMEYNQKIYIQNTSEQDVNYSVFANELLKQVNQNGNFIIETLITSIPVSDLTADEKERFLTEAVNTVKIDEKVTEEEIYFLLQLQAELEISNAIFKKLTSSIISSETKSNSTLKEYLIDVHLPEFELIE